MLCAFLGALLRSGEEFLDEGLHVAGRGGNVGTCPTYHYSVHHGPLLSLNNLN